MTESEKEHLTKQTLTWNDLSRSSFLLHSTLYVLAVDFIIYPSDLLTTRLQADTSARSNIKVRTLLANVARREGVRGLFKGFSVNTLGHFPGQFLFYTGYEFGNEAFRKLIPESTPPKLASIYGFMANAAAGFVAEAVASFSYLPTDIITQRLQVDARKKSNNTPKLDAFTIAKRIYHSEGILGFYRGFWPYLFVQGPMSATWWASYEITKSAMFFSYRLADIHDADKLGYTENGGWKILAHFISGASAGAISYIAVNPLEVAKTRYQLLEIGKGRGRSALKDGYLTLLKQVYRNEGITGLYKGIKPRLFIRTPVSALAFIGYEYLKESSVKKDP